MASVCERREKDARGTRIPNREGKACNITRYDRPTRLEDSLWLVFSYTTCSVKW